MPRVSNNFITMCYDNFPDLKEFVFSCKGRPFAMLSSQRISVPTLSLIDFNLVRDLGMKLKDIQCSQFTFAGHKLRILGKVSQTVQCVKDGKLQGNIHIKANVVEDLKVTFDTHSIAGEKMTKILMSENNKQDKKPSGPTSPSPSVNGSCYSGFGGSLAGTPSSRSSSPASSRSPSASSPPRSTPSGRPSSPPGFPPVPQYHNHRPPPDVTRCEPSAPLQRPPPGYVRTLHLKPDRNRFRSWHQGRVLQITRPGLADVLVLRPGGKSTFSEYCVYPGLEVEPNDVVLFHDHDTSPDLSWDEGRSRIWVVYSKEEVETLQSQGVRIPDCPPEYLPGGYYG